MEIVQPAGVDAVGPAAVQQVVGASAPAQMSEDMAEGMAEGTAEPVEGPVGVVGMVEQAGEGHVEEGVVAVAGHVEVVVVEEEEVRVGEEGAGVVDVGEEEVVVVGAGADVEVVVVAEAAAAAADVEEGDVTSYDVVVQPPPLTHAERRRGESLALFNRQLSFHFSFHSL